MSRSTCPTPTLVGIKIMNSNKQINNQINQNENKTARTRPTHATRKRIQYLIQRGWSPESAEIQAVEPMKVLKRLKRPKKGRAAKRAEKLAAKSKEEFQTSTENNSVVNKRVTYDTLQRSPVPSANSLAMPTLNAPTTVCSSMTRHVPVQARLGPPITRHASTSSQNMQTFVSSSPVQLPSEADDSDVDDNDDWQPNLNLAILPGEYPSELWSKAQLEAVQQSILDLIMRQNGDSVKPSFSGCTFREGWLSVRCNDVSTANWLKAMDTRLRPWDGASLKVITEPRRDEPNRHEFVGKFPALPSTSIKYTLQLIQAQNLELSSFIHDWSVLRRSQRGPIMELAIDIDTQSAEIIKANCYKINYAFSNVNFHPKEFL